jgi:hypothetical protein
MRASPTAPAAQSLSHPTVAAEDFFPSEPNRRFTMTTLTLRYELQNDDGLPCLYVTEGGLTQSERRSLDMELRRRYERLVRFRPRAVRFRTPITGLPHQAPFQLLVLAGTSPRCPTLLLKYSTHKPVARQAAAGGMAPPWVEGFLEELRDSLAAGYLNDAAPQEQAMFERRIEQLDVLYRRQPSQLARTLLKGFVKLCLCGDPGPLALLRSSPVTAETVRNVPDIVAKEKLPSL